MKLAYVSAGWCVCVMSCNCISLLTIYPCIFKGFWGQYMYMGDSPAVLLKLWWWMAVVAHDPSPCWRGHGTTRLHIILVLCWQWATCGSWHSSPVSQPHSYENTTLSQFQHCRCFPSRPVCLFRQWWPSLSDACNWELSYQAEVDVFQRYNRLLIYWSYRQTEFPLII